MIEIICAQFLIKIAISFIEGTPIRKYRI